MKDREENEETITAYFTADELLDSDEVCGMIFDMGVPMYLARRRKDQKDVRGAVCSASGS